MKSVETRFLLPLGTLAVLIVVNAALTAGTGTLGVVMASASLLLIGAVFLLFRVTVSRRLAGMAAHIEELAVRTESSWISPVTVRGDDEISALGRSFNCLLEKVRTEYSSLEGHIARRTAELQHANERLYAELDQRRRSEEALRESERIHRLLIDNATDMFSRHMPDSRIIYVTPSCERLLGYKPDDMVGRLAEEFVVREDSDRIWAAIKQAFDQGGDRYSAEFRMIRHDGSVIWADNLGRIIYDDKGGIAELHSSVRDITGRREAEDALRSSEEKFSKVFKASPVAISVTGLDDGLLIDVNAAFETLLGYTKEEVIGRTAGELKIWADPKDRERLLRKLEGGETVNDQEARFRTKDGRVVITRYSGEVAEIGGETCLLSLFVDITGRKLMEEKLKESNRRLADIIEFLPDATFIIDKEKRIVAWNRALEELTGTKAEDMVGKGDYEYAIPFYHERRPILIDLVLNPDPDMEKKYSSIRRVGGVLYAEAEVAALQKYLWGKVSPIYDENGRVSGAIETMQDVSVLKKVEEAFRESEERYRSLFENAIEGIFQTTPDGRLLMCNTSLARILGYDSPQDARERVTDIGTQIYADPEERRALVGRLLREGKVSGSEILFKRADGSPLKVMLNFRLVSDKDGNPLHIEGSCIDITARWMAEEAVKDSEKRIREIIENAPFGAHSYRLEADGRLIFTGGNPAADRILSLDHYSLFGKRIEEAFPMLEKTGIPDNYRKVALTGKRWEQEVVLHENKEITGAFEVFAFQTGPARMTAFFHDITGRKKAEEALRESEELLRATFNATADGILVVDGRGRISQMNQRFIEMWRVPQELQDTQEDEKLLAYVLDQLEDPDGFLAKVGKLYQSSREDLDEIRFKDGRVFDRYTCPVIMEGKETGRIWDFRDITVRTHALDDLRASEARYRRLHDSMMDAFVRVDLDGTIMECNESYLTMLGYDAGEIEGLTYQDVTPEKWHTFESKIIEKEVLPRGYSDVYEKEYRRRDGTVFPVEMRAYLLNDDVGKPMGMWAIVRDITERKQAEERLKEANRWLENIIEFLPDATLITDGDGRIIAWNRAIEEMTGVPKGEMLRKDHFEAMVPFYGAAGPYLVDFIGRDDAEVLSRYKNIRRKGETIYAEVFTPTLYDGRGAFIWAIASPLYNSEGKVIGAIESIRDITDRKRVEEALQAWMRRYDLIVEASGQVAYEFIVPTGDITWGKSIEKVLGYPSDEFNGGFAQWKDLLHPEDLQATLDSLVTAEKDCAFWDAQYRMRHKLGHYVWIRDRGFFLPGADGRAYNQLGMMEDITERKHAEEEFRKSEEKYRVIFEGAVEGIFQTMPDGKYATVNPAFARILGFDSPEELITGTFDSAQQFYVHPEERLLLRKMLKEKDRVKGFEVEMKRRDGRRIWVSLNVHTVLRPDGKLLYYEGTCEDITDRKKAEKALEESEVRYRLLAENASDIIFTMDERLRFTYISPSVEKIRGFSVEEAMTQSLEDALTPASLEAARKVFREEMEIEVQKPMELLRSRTMELEEKCRDGSTIWTETTFTPLRDEGKRFIGILGITRDITDRRKAAEERKRLEMQLTQAQKMESIGTLAGGIAHDFNNILAAIIGYTELAIDDLSEPDKVRRELREVLKAGDRARDLVGQILTFSRKTDITYSPLALRTVIKESLKMLRSVIPTTVEIRQDVSDSGLVLSDPTQINQIVMNLCTNAAHAMDKTGGILDVSLKKAHIDPDAARDLEVTAGSYLRLTVSDTGHGISPEVLDRIFEPYFTTKELGRGTGLGLSVVHGIVKSHKGAIVCRSIPGRGTAFEVYLPEIETEMKTAAPLRREPLPTGTERILFVDDEPTLTGLAEKMLSKLGYRVVIRTSSVEAFDMFRAGPGEFDLVITDMTMPFMTGDSMAQKILDIRPDIPIILCTGYSEHITEERARSIGIREFLLKPVEMADLAKTVRKVLDSGE